MQSGVRLRQNGSPHSDTDTETTQCGRTTIVFNPIFHLHQSESYHSQAAAMISSFWISRSKYGFSPQIPFGDQGMETDANEPKYYMEWLQSKKE